MKFQWSQVFIQMVLPVSVYFMSTIYPGPYQGGRAHAATLVHHSIDVPYTTPPPKFSKIWVLRIYIHVHNDKCAHTSVNSYVTIIYLPLISNFISIMQTRRGSSDLYRWLNHNSKGSSLQSRVGKLKSSATAVYLFKT